MVMQRTLYSFYKVKKANVTKLVGTYTKRAEENSNT